MYDFLVKKKVHSLTVLNANKSFENKDFKKLVNKIIKKMSHQICIATYI